MAPCWHVLGNCMKKKKKKRWELVSVSAHPFCLMHCAGGEYWPSLPNRAPACNYVCAKGKTTPGWKIALCLSLWAQKGGQSFTVQCFTHTHALTHTQFWPTLCITQMYTLSNTQTHTDDASQNKSQNCMIYAWFTASVSRLLRMAWVLALLGCKERTSRGYLCGQCCITLSKTIRDWKWRIEEIKHSRTL